MTQEPSNILITTDAQALLTSWGCSFNGTLIDTPETHNNLVFNDETETASIEAKGDRLVITMQNKDGSSENYNWTKDEMFSVVEKPPAVSNQLPTDAEVVTEASEPTTIAETEVVNENLISEETPATEDVGQLEATPLETITPSTTLEPDNKLIQQINKDFEEGRFDEAQRDEYIRLASEENLMYVNVAGTPQYLSKEDIEWLENQGRDTSLEVEILITANGEHEGEKAKLEDLKSMMKTAEPGEKPVADEDKPPAETQGLVDDSNPQVDLPDDFVPSEDLQNLAGDLPPISAVGPGGTIEIEQKTEVEGEQEKEAPPQDTVVTDQQGAPEQIVVREQEEQADMPVTDPAPKMPPTGAPGQQQQKQPDPTKAFEEQEKEVGEGFQENAAEQAERALQAAEQEEQEKPNRKTDAKPAPKKKKGIGAVGGAVGATAGAGGCTAGVLGASGQAAAQADIPAAAHAAVQASAHAVDNVLALISIFT